MEERLRFVARLLDGEAMTAHAGARVIDESLNAAAFATNAGVIDLLAFVLVWGRAGAACSFHPS
jgi:hypothetical protein